MFWSLAGCFAWSRLEPREGEYEFGWLDRVFELLHAASIGVVLCTATASPPPWLTLRYPASRPVGRVGGAPVATLLHGGARTHFSPHCADYRRLAAALASRLAARYGAHPALRAFHVNNEYGAHPLPSPHPPPPVHESSWQSAESRGECAGQCTVLPPCPWVYAFGYQ